MVGTEFLLIDPVSLVQEAAAGWQYLIIFILAAIPWIEILVVIPAGIIVGLNPFFVAVAAAAGNIIPIYLIIALYRKIESRYIDKEKTGFLDNKFEKQRKRAYKYWSRYGLLGLAIISPALIGVHLATVVALIIGSDKKKLAIYMTISVIGWTVILTITTITGIMQLK